MKRQNGSVGAHVYLAEVRKRRLKSMIQWGLFAVLAAALTWMNSLVMAAYQPHNFHGHVWTTAR